MKSEKQTRHTARARDTDTAQPPPVGAARHQTLNTRAMTSNMAAARLTFGFAFSVQVG
jgi:hypothetical protein